MAELADAYGSGPYVRKDMQVQVLLSAPPASCRALPRGRSQARFAFYRTEVCFRSQKSHQIVKLAQWASCRALHSEGLFYACRTDDIQMQSDYIKGFRE